MTVGGDVRSVYRRAAGDSHGQLEVRVELVEGEFQAGDRLGMCTGVRMRPTASSAVEVAEAMATRLLLRPDPGTIEGSRVWTISALRPETPLQHANDGPVSAWIERAGSTIELRVAPAELDAPEPAHQAGSAAPRKAGEPRSALLPRVAALESHGLPRPGVGVTCTHDPEDRWRTVAALAARLGVDVTAGPEVLYLEATVDDDLADGAYELAIDRRTANLRGASPTALTHGMITLAQLVAAGVPERAHIADRPRYRHRGLSLDLARRWIEPSVVERLIDVLAWRKLSHLQLHLTDDEAWRVPIDAYPALADVGGVRGHGLPIGPLCGSGPAPYGRAYTRAEIGRWVERARSLAVELVPEIDIPGHCYAAIVAVPELRDDDDRSGAQSIQGFHDNVLIPGPATTRFLHEAFGSLADLFPHSPVLHVGGDEVPPAAWTRSPRAAEYGRVHGIEPGPAMAAALIGDAAAAIDAAGRGWAGWQEVAAFDHTIAPSYVVAWKSTAAIATMLARGHHVVASPADAFYLDMAVDDGWSTPGASWSGSTSLAATCSLELPTGGETNTRLLGGQAAMWGEHVSSLGILDELLFPRLDAIAEITWAGDAARGADDIGRRSLRHPTLLRQTPSPPAAATES